MSLIGTLNLASNALAVQQAALQTTSNNVANAGNTDYTRQTAHLTPGTDQEYSNGIFIGTGVNLNSITRQIDEALQQRIDGAASDSSAASTSSNYLGQIESTLNALGDQNLSTQLSTFFKSWSSLANNPTDMGNRQVVVQDGGSLASYIQGLGGQLGQLGATVNNDIASQATQ
ncbi:MAG: hypothetical protein JO353_00275, partial [Phycisphaerae bacterium]|nr:hypothetical protein [Phycisphaerae bacterium]